jgi:hypothetical protein
MQVFRPVLEQKVYILVLLWIIRMTLTSGLGLLFENVIFFVSIYG